MAGAAPLLAPEADDEKITKTRCKAPLTLTTAHPLRLLRGLSLPDGFERQRSALMTLMAWPASSTGSWGAKDPCSDGGKQCGGARG